MSIVELYGGTWKQKHDVSMDFNCDTVFSNFSKSCSSVHSRGLCHGVGFDQPTHAASWISSKWTTDSSAKITFEEFFRTSSRTNLSSFPGWMMTLASGAFFGIRDSQSFTISTSKSSKTFSTYS